MSILIGWFSKVQVQGEWVPWKAQLQIPVPRNTHADVIPARLLVCTELSHPCLFVGLRFNPSTAAPRAMWILAAGWISRSLLQVEVLETCRTEPTLVRQGWGALSCAGWQPLPTGPSTETVSAALASKGCHGLAGTPYTVWLLRCWKCFEGLFSSKNLSTRPLNQCKHIFLLHPIAKNATASLYVVYKCVFFCLIWIYHMEAPLNISAFKLEDG